VELRQNLLEAVNRAAFGKERVILTRRGRKLAGIVPYADVEFLEALEDAKKETISLQCLKKELGF
jgi:prevent-host-death family protein